ncbi:hypothetical protein G3M48_006976 [Beauveria asiatica]|uniref:Uncharacterized protein n=1 Tax=Beauveria asiatica TaxID=1069075 RepID=A0AAW0RN21_9HYPO
MPGAFHNDAGATTASPPLIFRPPVSSPSPSASAFLERRRRKRGRPGTAATADDDAPPVVSLFGAAAVPQHTPVKAYALAGTLDTPDHAEANVLGESMYSDSNYRTALGSKRSRHDNDDDDASSGGAPTSLFRHDPPVSPPQGWGSVAISAVGGVVGRVWEFCKAGAFKGFYAGGGRGFAMTLTGATVERPDDAPLPPADDYSCNYHFHHYDDYEHRVPGHFPASQTDDTSYHFRAVVDDTAPPTLANNEQHHRYPYKPASPSPSIPAAKRRQTTHADDLGRNWVFVNDRAHNNSSSSGHRSSPRNRNYTPSVTTGRRISATPNSSRASMPSAPRFSYRPETPSEQQQRRPPSSASYASPRSASPTKPASTPYTYHHPYTTASTASIASPSQTHSYSGSQSRSGGGGGHRRRRSGTVVSTSAHRRANSAASAASSRGDSGEAPSPRKIDSPRLDAEAKQLAARRKMEERDADVRISAFNKRLQDMIRQGKEALGTTIEIDDAAGDDWVDEE